METTNLVDALELIQNSASIHRKLMIQPTSDILQGSGLPIALVPPDYTVELLTDKIAKHLPRPLRTKAHATFPDAQSFVAYLNIFGIRDQTLVFYDPTRGVYRAIIDHHMPETPAWGEHTATLELKKSTEWNTWNFQNGKNLTQTEFAELLEDNLQDIASPPGIEMLEIARAMEATKTSSFKSGIRLSNGSNHIQWNDETKGQAGGVDIPERFTLHIPVLENGDQYPVEARLRYRIKDSSLVLAYRLHRPEKVFEAAVKNTTVFLQDKLPDFPILLGTAG